MRYALALEGGGVRGAFEAGVWKAIQELKLEVAAIAGTSIGAINGAMFASGSDALSLWQEISLQDVINLPEATGTTAVTSYVKEFLRGGIDTTPLRQLLETHFSEEALRSSPIDYGLSTYAVEDKKEVDVFKQDIPEGEMLDYILASACFPLFKPALIHGKQYVDGGVCNNLPVNLLAAKGYKHIIAVSIRGVGLRKMADVCGVNVIEIHAEKAEVGILEFNKKGIFHSIDSGYCACMRAFGQYVGRQYYFFKEDYFKAQAVYGKNLLDNLEKAAELLKIYPYKVYTVEELVGLVMEAYPNHKILSVFVDQLKHNEYEKIRKLMGTIPGLFDAANAIVCFAQV